MRRTTLSALAGLLALLATLPAIAEPTVLITGANRGIGLEIARIYAARDWQVIATARQPAQASALQSLARLHEGVVIERLDVTDASQVSDLAQRYRGRPIDVLINNAGILGDVDGQRFGQFDYATFDRIFAVNTKGPARMMEAFVEHVSLSEQKKIIAISSAVGSIQMAFGGQSFYRASKAALNMLVRNTAREMRRSSEPGRKALVFGLIDPGVVDTGFAKNVPVPMISAEESAGAVVSLIDSWDKDRNAKFFTYTGKELPW